MLESVGAVPCSLQFQEDQHSPIRHRNQRALADLFRDDIAPEEIEGEGNVAMTFERVPAVERDEVDNNRPVIGLLQNGLPKGKRLSYRYPSVRYR